MVEAERVLEAVGADGTARAVGFGDDDVDVHVAPRDGEEDVDGQVLASASAFPGVQHDMDQGFQPHLPAASREL